MKKIIAILLTAALLLGLTACGGDAAPTEETGPSTTSTPETFPSETPPLEEITVEALLERSVPEAILQLVDSIRVDYETSEDSQSTTYSMYVKVDGIIYYDRMTESADGSYVHIYFSNDPSDGWKYLESSTGNETKKLAQEELHQALSDSFLDYGYYTDAAIVSAEEIDGSYRITVEVQNNGALYHRDELTVDVDSGFISTVKTTYYSDGVEVNTITQRLTYGEALSTDPSDSVEIDTITQQSTYGETLSTDPTEEAQRLEFSTVDIHGEVVTSEMMRDAQLVMVNFWEPWCGPCVGEMPELQALYEAYQEQGLLILGVFSSTDMMEDAKAVVEDIGITYPILQYDDQLAAFTTDYVPTTVFTDGQGNVLSAEPVIGANDYETWEAMVKGYLG